MLCLFEFSWVESWYWTRCAGSNPNLFNLLLWGRNACIENCYETGYYWSQVIKWNFLECSFELNYNWNHHKMELFFTFLVVFLISRFLLFVFKSIDALLLLICSHHLPCFFLLFVFHFLLLGTRSPIHYGFSLSNKDNYLTYFVSHWIFILLVIIFYFILQVIQISNTGSLCWVRVCMR